MQKKTARAAVIAETRAKERVVALSAMAFIAAGTGLFLALALG
ncbi:MAG: hypothetical protein AAF761_06440 [Pseudomonadota bacterium]